MGRTLLITRTCAYGDMWIPNEERLGIQLAQAIIHYVFYRRRFPEFECPIFKTDVRTEVYDLFTAHDGVQRIPKEQLDCLIDMGVGYMLAFRETLKGYQEQHQYEPELIAHGSVNSNHVILVI